jgi:hypothetical protein
MADSPDQRPIDMPARRPDYGAGTGSNAEPVLVLEDAVLPVR